MTLPNFLVIGAAKSGTTSLVSYLAQHPDIFVPTSKEPNFFALSGQQNNPVGPAPPHILRQMLYNWSRSDLADYTAMFDGAGAARAIGEGSVRYLYFPDAPIRVHNMLPDTRIIAILREPVARLYSHYNMNRQNQLEPLELKDALMAEDRRVADGWGWDWHYRRLSQYSVQLKRWFDLFPRDQIQVHFYDDFAANPHTVISDICRHIGVNPDFTPDMRRRGMVSTRPHNLWLDRQLNWPSSLRYKLLSKPFRNIMLPVMRRLNRWNSRPVPPLSPAQRAEIEFLFFKDWEQLSELLQRKVPWQHDISTY